MKNFISTVSLLLLVVFSAKAQDELVVEGTYQGENLYVQNPFSESGVGFCVIDVSINDEQSIDEINSSAFEIDFSSYQLFKGQSVVVKISYKSGCKPRVLNPEVLKPTSTFKISAISVAKDGTISWSTTDESGVLPYIVEQYRWNKWIKIGEVKGKGLSAKNSYTFKAKPHSGPNKFRLKQVDHTRKPRYSKAAKLIRSSTLEVMITNPDLKKIKTSINFGTPTGAPTETMYEIVDMNGRLVTKGVANKVDVSTFKKGTYYISFDNTFKQFTKK